MKRTGRMLPRKIIFKKTRSDDIDNGPQYGVHGKDVYKKSLSPHLPPAIRFRRVFGVSGLEIGDHGDKRRGKTQNSKKMPHFTGQQMFAVILHDGSILA